MKTFIFHPERSINNHFADMANGACALGQLALSCGKTRNELFANNKRNLNDFTNNILGLNLPLRNIATCDPNYDKYVATTNIARLNDDESLSWEVKIPRLKELFALLDVEMLVPSDLTPVEIIEDEPCLI